MTRKTKLIRDFSYTVLATLGVMTYSAAANATCTTPMWVPGATYDRGAVVQYNGHNYQVIQQNGVRSEMRKPSNLPDLWADKGVCEAESTIANATCTTPMWVPGATYDRGAVVRAGFAKLDSPLSDKTAS